MVCTQQAGLAWGFQHPLTSTLPSHSGRHRIHLCLGTVRYASTARTFGNSCWSYKIGQKWKLKLQGKKLVSSTGGVAKPGCPRPQGTCGKVGWEWPWLLCWVPCRGAEPATVCPLTPFPWVLCRSPWTPTPRWLGPQPSTWRVGRASRDGLLGGWWVSKPRFVLFRWMWSGLGRQLGWIRLLKATLNITIGSFCFSLHISVCIDLPVA